jgi:chromosome segregation ATPase
MEPNYSKIFNKETLGSVESFCKLNNIDDVDSFIKNVFQEGFNIKKYGLLGNTVNKGEKDLKPSVIEEKRVEIEVIREIRVEIPVEVIKEVEKIVEVIKEVPVEKVVIQEVIKEVPVDRVVEKIIYTTDDIQINELGGKIAELEEERQIFSTKIAELEEERQIFSTKTEEMENNFQNEISKKDKELGDLRQKLDDPVTNDKIKLLQETLQNLRGELQQKNEQIREIEKINRDLLNGNQNQAYLLRGSNLNKRV